MVLWLFLSGAFVIFISVSLLCYLEPLHPILCFQFGPEVIKHLEKSHHLPTFRACKIHMKSTGKAGEFMLSIQNVRFPVQRNHLF